MRPAADARAALARLTGAGWTEVVFIGVRNGGGLRALVMGAAPRVADAHHGVSFAESGHRVLAGRRFAGRVAALILLAWLACGVAGIWVAFRPG
jgi:hypothetical protein